MNTIRLSFQHLSEQTCDMLTALLSNADAHGFETEGQWFYAWFSENAYDEAHVRRLLAPLQLSYTTDLVPQQNWNALWEQQFEPVIVNETVGLRAHFHPPLPHLPYEIEITPKMSFGTGHHATTQLMLQALCEKDTHQLKVFDFGCGTGVLGIFAAMKGASYVLGTDNDAWSVENAKENCTRNHCVVMQISDQDIDNINDSFDLILANINLNILLKYCQQLFSLTKPGGCLLLSGVMISDKENIIRAYEAGGFVIRAVNQLREWVAIDCYRP